LVCWAFVMPAKIEPAHEHHPESWFQTGYWSRFYQLGSVQLTGAELNQLSFLFLTIFHSLISLTSLIKKNTVIYKSSMSSKFMKSVLLEIKLVVCYCLINLVKFHCLFYCFIDSVNLIYLVYNIFYFIC
jgi:hypothetical protein